MEHPEHLQPQEFNTELHDATSRTPDSTHVPVEIETIYTRRKELLAYIEKDIEPALREQLVKKIDAERSLLMNFLMKSVAQATRVREADTKMRGVLDPALFVRKSPKIVL